MRLLLDTHTFLWALREPELISVSARHAFEAADVVLVSSVTAYELAYKVRLGRFLEAAPVVSAFKKAVRRLGAVELAISSAHALRAGSLDWEHRDPWDRILVTQAQIEGAVLVSRDRAMATAPDVRILW